MTGSEPLLAALIVMVAATVQATVGFGLALISVPLLTLVNPDLVPAPLMICAVALSVLIGRREVSDTDWRAVGLFISGRVPGAVLAGFILTIVARERLAVVFALAVIVAVALSASGIKARPTVLNFLAAGSFSGLMSTITGIGGPPIALVLQDENPSRLRSTLAWYFASGSIVSLTVLARVGRLGGQELRFAAVMLPGALVGFLLSRFTRPLAEHPGVVRGGVWAISVAASITILVRELL
ncbi:MAG TPA: sulfite exporter TauE/SafE family protein [Acidimicrobiales bacterium]|nr:sulfite exporter TauE/SafE family protein [Acidimicrobiales bacterium]